jgi:hypothetical protein
VVVDRAEVSAVDPHCSRNRDHFQDQWWTAHLGPAVARAHGEAGARLREQFQWLEIGE